MYLPTLGERTVTMAEPTNATPPTRASWIGKERSIAIAVLAALVCSGAAFLALRSGAVGPLATPTAPLEAQSDWPVGQRVRYTMHWESDAVAVGQNPETGLEEREDLSHIDVKAKLALTRVEGPPGQTVLSAQLLDPRVESKTNGQANLRTQELGQELSQPFLIFFQRGGRVDRVQMPSKLGTTGFSVFKSVASFIQRVGPDKTDPLTKTEWNAVEPDLTGKADFEYRLDKDQLRKTKLAYVSLVEGRGNAPDQGPEPTVEVLASTHVHRLGTHESTVSWSAPVHSIIVQESTRVTVGQNIAPMESRTRFELSRTDSEQLRSEETKALTQGDWVSAAIDQLPPDETRRRDRDAASVAGRTLTQLTRSIVELENAIPRNRQGEARLFSSLVSKLRIDPGALAEAGSKARAGQDQKLLLDAIGNAGTPESQTLLASLIRERRFDHEQTRSSLINLSTTKAPTPETVEFLKETRADPQHGNQARLGLGSAAHALKDSDPAAAIPIVQELTDGVKQSKSPSDTELGLRALGNSGSELALDTCESYFDSTHPNIRIGAISCARLVPGPRADALLVRGLSDTTEGVVREAISAVLHRPYAPVLVPPLVLLARSGATRTLRILATQVLGRYLPTAPELLAIIQEIAKNDPDVELKSYAQQIIAKYGRR